ncbi:MAG: hypothetical protein H6536_03520 [Bacteroidales bacterium]|nr:hypothetical protein [Bacteroidales bacterium]
MKPSLKVKISNLTTWIMLGTIALIILWFIGFIVSVTFDLNVFTSRTSEFFFSFIGFAAVLVTCAAILSISLNISLIADSKIQEMKLDSSKTLITKKFIYTSSLVIAMLIAFLFAGDYLSRQNEKAKLVSEAEDLIARYQKSIEELTLFIQDTAQLGKIPEFLNVLSNQKEEFPTITILTSEKYKDETVFLEISGWTTKESLQKPYYDNSFYKCSMNDCDYLLEVFEKGKTDSFFWTEKNNYRYYYPIEKNGKQMLLLFSKYQRYGKFGS